MRFEGDGLAAQPDLETFTVLTNQMTVARAGRSAVTSIDGRLLTVGGFDGSQNLTSVDIFDPQKDSVLAGAPLATTDAHSFQSLHAKG